MEEAFEVKQCNENDIFMVAFVLSLSDADRAIKKLGCKQSMIYLGSTRNFWNSPHITDKSGSILWKTFFNTFLGSKS